MYVFAALVPPMGRLSRTPYDPPKVHVAHVCADGDAGDGPVVVRGGSNSEVAVDRDGDGFAFRLPPGSGKALHAAPGELVRLRRPICDAVSYWLVAASDQPMDADELMEGWRREADGTYTDLESLGKLEEWRGSDLAKEWEERRAAGRG